MSSSANPSNTDATLNTDIKNSSPSKALPVRQQGTVFTRVLKIFNIVIAFITVCFGVYCYFGFTRETGNANIDLNDPSMIILPGYVALSGLIILAVQTELKIIHHNMSFLLNYLGRGLFNVYVGVLCLAMIRDGQDELYTVMVYTSAGLLAFLGACYIGARLFCCARSPAQQRVRQERLLLGQL